MLVYLNFLASTAIASMSSWAFLTANTEAMATSIIVCTTYCYFDMVVLLVKPGSQPGPARWATIFAHHAAIVALAPYFEEKWALIIGQTFLIEWSTVFLNLNRIAKARWSNVLFVAAWLGRLVNLAWLTPAVLHSDAPPLFKAAWATFPAVSVFWTLEALNRVPASLRARWSREPPTVPASSAILLVPEILGLVGSSPTDRALPYLLAVSSSAFHSVPSRTTAAMDCFSIMLATWFHQFRQLGAAEPFRTIAALILATAVTVRMPRARTKVSALCLCLHVGMLLARGSLLPALSLVFLLMCAYTLHSHIHWGDTHACSFKCYAWHSTMALLYLCICQV